MIRHALVLLFLLAGLGALSCSTFDLPSETCDPATLDALRDPDETDGNCSRCLEDHCCDVVGRCEAKPGCMQIVHDAHRCVLDAGLQGAANEATCTTDPKHDISQYQESSDAYHCMRDNCGVDCSLPVCQLDQAATLIRNAACDRCFSGACCTPLNRCYADRACKLMVQCLVTDCGSELGPALAAANGVAPDAGERSSADITALCAAGAPAPPDLPPCALNCFCRYANNDQGLPPTDPAMLPLNLAEDVYNCGKAANCGNPCTAGPDDAGGD